MEFFLDYSCRSDKNNKYFEIYYLVIKQQIVSLKLKKYIYIFAQYKMQRLFQTQW